jgi:RimJ/RimL family protein N-acetyltransferase
LDAARDVLVLATSYKAKNHVLLFSSHRNPYPTYTYTMDSLRNAWRSDNLVYRSIEENDEDFAFIKTLRSDPVNLGFSTKGMLRPPTAKATKEYMGYFPKDILAVMICLPPRPLQTEEQTEPDNTKNEQTRALPKATPIGFLALFDPVTEAAGIHRNALLCISLAEHYRGNGYGTEAINFALDFAFRCANLHRVALEVFSYNASALRVYEKVGFVVEGRKREDHFFDGVYHDTLTMGILKKEWALLRGTKYM